MRMGCKRILTGLLLALPALLAQAEDFGLVANKTTFKLGVAPRQEGKGGAWFTLTPTDVEGREATGPGRRSTLAVEAMLGSDMPLEADRALRLRSEHEPGHSVQIPFRVSGVGPDGVTFDLSLLFGCNKVGADVRCFMSVESSLANLETMPFKVVTSEREPHKIVLEPKLSAQAPGQAEVRTSTEGPCCLVM